MVDRLSYFSFQPVLHDWCNKGCGMCYPVCGMMYIKEPLLLIGKSSPCGGSGFPLSLSEWSFTIIYVHCHITVNKMCWRKEGNVLFNDTLNTFYLLLYGISHMVKHHSDSERGNPLPPHGLLFPINSKGSFLYAPSHTQDSTYHGLCYTNRGALAWLKKCLECIVK